MRRLFLSFLSLICGWGVGFLYFVGYSMFYGGRVTDAQSMLFWTGIFVLISWVTFVAPLILFIPGRSKLFSIRIFPFFGSAYGVGAFLLLVGWWTGFWKYGLYWGHAAVIGIATGFVYSFFLGKSSIEKRVQKRF